MMHRRPTKIIIISSESNIPWLLLGPQIEIVALPQFGDYIVAITEESFVLIGSRSHIESATDQNAVMHSCRSHSGQMEHVSR